jgi:hypothetical protein
MHYKLRKPDRISSHINAKEDVFPSFFIIEPDKIVFKDSILIALNLELETKKPETKLRKKA